MVADNAHQPSSPILAVEGYAKSYGSKRAAMRVSLQDQ